MTATTPTRPGSALARRKPAPPALDEPAQVRAHLSRCVRNYEIRDLALPAAANVFILAVLFWAWGVAKTWSAVGDYFLVPCIISAFGLVVGQVILASWWFNRHRWGGRVTIAEEDATVTRADLVVLSVARKGAPVPLGPPSLVRVGARLPCGETLTWTVQAAAWRDGTGIGRSVGPVALLGVPLPGRWLLGIDSSGEILWPTTPVAPLAAASP